MVSCLGLAFGAEKSKLKVEFLRLSKAKFDGVVPKRDLEIAGSSI